MNILSKKLSKVVNLVREELGLSPDNTSIAELLEHLAADSDSYFFDQIEVIMHYDKHYDEEIVGEYLISMELALELLVSQPTEVRIRVTELLMNAYRSRCERVNSKKANKVNREDYEVVNIHGMTSNRLFRGKLPSEEPNGAENRKHTDDGLVKTDLYKNWLSRFPRHEVPSQEYFEKRGVDFTKPIHLRLGFVHMSYFDMMNFEKAFIDVLMNERNGIIQVDDAIIHKVTKETFGTCNSYAGGKIYFHISNIEDGE